eukprot:359402-Chlamydomonas_euryale.AAC.7
MAVTAAVRDDAEGADHKRAADPSKLPAQAGQAPAHGAPQVDGVIVACTYDTMTRLACAPCDIPQQPRVVGPDACVSVQHEDGMAGHMQALAATIACLMTEATVPFLITLKHHADAFTALLDQIIAGQRLRAGDLELFRDLDKRMHVLEARRLAIDTPVQLDAAHRAANVATGDRAGHEQAHCNKQTVFRLRELPDAVV